MKTLQRFLTLDPKVVIKKGQSVGPSVPQKPLEVVNSGIAENHKRLFGMLHLLRKYYS